MQRQKGSAAIITIMAVMILATVGGYFVMLTSSNLTTAAEFQNAASAQYAAEAGARAAIAMFAAGSPDWDILSAETEVLGFAGAYYKVETNHSLTGAALSKQLPTPGENYKVTATGKYKKAIRIINFTVTAAEGTSPLAVSAWR